MELSCLFCLEQIKENSALNPIGCPCRIQAHTTCLEKWFDEKHQIECPICHQCCLNEADAHTISIPNPLFLENVQVVYINIPEGRRRRFNPIVEHEKAAAFCCCLLLGWAFTLSILEFISHS